MTEDERRAALWAAAFLLLASLVRLGWEMRPVDPLLTADTTAYAELIEETRAAVEDQERRQVPLAPGERIDPNRAPEVELARLPGVGPALASRIAAARRAAPFQRSEDLLDVPGVGAGTLARLAEYLDLDDPPPPSAGTGVGGGEADRVAVNRVGAAELQALPGIGPALAERIVADRALHGAFDVPEDLLRVPGIGPSTLEAILPLVSFAR